jgi:hypothetical protein
MDRIFTACHGTQLLVIQHLRHHLQSPAKRDFLLWYPMDNVPRIEVFMKDILATAGFADVLDIRDFAALQPRVHGPVTWPFETVRRLRQDAATLHRWMSRNAISEQDAELWADDPAQFYVDLPRGILRKARHVKIPHCFNHEDVTSSQVKRKADADWQATPWPKKYLFGAWQRWASGVDLRPQRVVYDRAYSFDLPSSWVDDSIDVSELISIDRFEATYRTLPEPLRTAVEANLGQIKSAAKPLLLLLLFGFGTGPQTRRIYEKAIARIFSDHAAELKNCSLAVKVHPGSIGIEEPVFFDWLRANVPAQIYPITHSLNLEFLLPQLRPDYVLAGLCGALPIIRALKIGKAVGISELIDAFQRDNPTYPVSEFLKGIEIW